MGSNPMALTTVLLLAAGASAPVIHSVRVFRYVKEEKNASMRRRAGLLRQLFVKLVQQVLEIDKRLASVSCPSTRCFEFFKFREVLAERFNNSLGTELKIGVPHLTAFLTFLQAPGLRAAPRTVKMTNYDLFHI
jgi:hypothetical protein